MCAFLRRTRQQEGEKKNGGGGGNQTRVRKSSAFGSTCLAISLI